MKKFAVDLVGIAVIVVIVAGLGYWIAGAIRYWVSAEPIRIVAAVYGENCGVKLDNATPLVQRVCDGRETCKFAVDLGQLGDAAPGCEKDFNITYRCPWSDRPLSANVIAEAHGRTATLDCRPRQIEVIDATYGRNCQSDDVNAAVPGRFRAGNATAAVQIACMTSARCEFAIDVARLGDPAPGCAKDFNVTYRCRSERATRTASSPPEAHGHSVNLECGAGG
jgi:hypothetical protein